MDLNEWLSGFEDVTDHGFVALQGISSSEEATTIFSMIDDNGGGLVLLDEWCTFLKNCEIAANTQLGQLLNAESECRNTAPSAAKAKRVSGSLFALVESGKKKKTDSTSWSRGSAPTPVDPKAFLKVGSGKYNATKLLTGSTKSPEEIEEALREWLGQKPAFETSTDPNAFGLALGVTASEDLRNFVSVFEPMVAETAQGESLRADGFIAATQMATGSVRLLSSKRLFFRSSSGHFQTPGRASSADNLETISSRHSVRALSVRSRMRPITAKTTAKSSKAPRTRLKTTT
jgi:hypothetical protein